MLHNYFKILLRNLARHKVFSLINIVGLSVGMAACLLIFLFIQNELSFDSFHSEKEQVYRLNEVQTWDGIIPQKVALSMYPMGPALQEEFPEVEAYTRLLNRQDVPLQNGDKKIFAEKLYIVDTAFFDLFDFELVYGDKTTALHGPNDLLITETMARKLFDDPNAVGKQLEVRNEDTTVFTVAGILKDIPDNSHLQFDGLISMKTIGKDDQDRMLQNWGSNWLVTYLKLVPGTNIDAMEAKFPDFLTQHMGEDATDGYQLFVQSLAEVHLASTDITHDYQNYRKFDGKYIKIFSVLALFVLLIASINFMNLSTARSIKRAREVGIRKTIGATHGHLARQFILESITFAVIAIGIALLISYFTLPYLNELSQREISFGVLGQPLWLLMMLGGTLLVGLMAGLYPALFMAGFKPIEAIKGQLRIRAGRFSLQNILVVAQFAIATCLIIGTLLVAQQLRYMTDRHPGFQTEQVMLLPGTRALNESYTSFKEELLTHPDIIAVASSGQRLGNNIHQTGIRVKADTAEQGLAISHLNIDYDYIELYDIELLDGRSFSKEYAQDEGHAFVINEELAKKLGWDDPVGKAMKFGWHEEWGQVIGLVKDFNYNSLHEGINPLAMSVQPRWGVSEVSIKIYPNKLGNILPFLEEKWMATGTDFPFEYEFLDTHFEALYQADRQVTKVVSIIALLAIFIACLGLYGLVSLAAERRVKELGIRKVMGASVSQLLILLGKGVSSLVVIAFVIAAPLSAWFMHGWLENFAYRIEMGWGTFVLAGIAALLIALLTISYRAYTAASANPIEALREE